ncbi:LpqB family beta-propeller domain-containing protein [Dactylosporangium sp. CA-052675]|uniref:LpqB family beta-propeller domain-containing protein n=1 Tax=Dactylosporangium sp. CA-052675 TaxID=3239927 RepID=UPI003D931EC3
MTRSLRPFPAPRTAVTARLRRGLAMVATLAAFAVLGGGCGLPSQTEPRYAGPAQSPAAAQGGQKTPPKPTDGMTSEQLIERFLQASVGANLGGDGGEPDANQEALIRMKGFMVTATAEAWKPQKSGGVVIVRDPHIEPVPNGNGRDTAEVKLTPLGVLNESGQVTRWTSGTLPTANFSTVLVGGQRRLQDVPTDYIYMSESGLREWYTQQPIYFWSNGGDSPRLVPDLRYMPSSLSPAKQVAETMRWLQRGPGQLLSPVVNKWADAFEVKDNPVLEDSDVKVNLSGKAAGQSKEDLIRLARQIRWSLPDHKPVKLAIETQDFGVDTEGYVDYNPAVEAATVDQSKVYVIVNEAVRSMTLSSGTTENPLFMPGGQNKGVVSAAINRQGSRAALVTKSQTGGKSEQHLLVSMPDQSVGSAPKYADVGLAAPRLSRPAWISYPVKRLMIADGNQLWVSRTEEGNKEYDPVELGATSSAAITAFAVAPEGRRIAFISNRQLMVAPLLYDKDGNKFSIGTVQPVTTSLGDNQAVGWLTETTLAVGGKPSPRSVHPIGVGNDGPRYNIVAVTIDGAQEEPLPAFSRTTDAATEVTELVTRVNRPGFPLDYSIVSEANGVAQRMYSTSNDPIPVTPEPNPPALVTAPFFAD